MSHSERSATKGAVFEDAKHFKWRITNPTLISKSRKKTTLPGRIYKPAAVQVGGTVVVMAWHHSEWTNTRVLFYNIEQHSWSIIHSHGPNRAGCSEVPLVGIVDEYAYLLPMESPRVHCFDLVLGEWVWREVDGSVVQRHESARGFMESINSFIYWDRTKGPSVSVLDLKSLKWSEHMTKGEWPIRFGSYPLSCYHGRTVYMSWRDASMRTELHILTSKGSNFYWSKPVLRGFRPLANYGGSISYSAGRLFKIGGFASPMPNTVFVYSVAEGEWHKVANDSSSEYTMQGPIPRAASHSAIALNSKIMIFGGVSLVFKSCRMLEAT